MTCIAVAWIALNCAAPCAVGEGQSVFDSVYGKKYRAALATSASTDDLQLAKELAAAAEAEETPAEVELYFHVKVAELAAKSPDGFSLAVEANLAAIEQSKEERAAARERLADLFGKRLRTGKPEEKIHAADLMVKVFTDAGEEQMVAKSYTEAAKAFRRALGAVPARSAAADALSKRIDKALSLERSQAQIATLQSRLLRNATDHVAADELVRLFVMRRDDPAGAVKFLDRAKDEQFKAHVPVAAKEFEELTDAQCMTLAEWYRGLSETSDATAKDTMVGRATRYLSRFLELHESNDAARTKAALLLKELGGPRPQDDPWEKIELSENTFAAQLWGGKRFATRPLDVFRHSNTEGFLTVTQSTGKDIGKVMLEGRRLTGDFSIRARLSGTGGVGVHMPGGSVSSFALVDFDQPRPTDFVITRKDGDITITRAGKRETVNVGKNFNPHGDCIFGIHILRDKTVHIHELRILRKD